MTKADFEQIKLLMTQFADTVNSKIEGLEKLLVEKLNGHTGDMARIQKEVDQLYSLDRERVQDVASLWKELEKVRGEIKTNAVAVKAEEEGRDKRDDAVAAVKTEITTKKLVWVSSIVGLVAALGAALLAWLLTGAK